MVNIKKCLSCEPRCIDYWLRSLAHWITAAHAEIIHIHKVSVSEFSESVLFHSFSEYKDKPIEWIQTSFATSKFKHGKEIL